jgi:hypothetical protein
VSAIAVAVLDATRLVLLVMYLKYVRPFHTVVFVGAARWRLVCQVHVE